MTCSKLDDSAINGNGDATTVCLERETDLLFEIAIQTGTIPQKPWSFLMKEFTC
ncbi:hypothetical protein KoxyNG13_002030 [Klebsiella pasteurii]